MSVSSPSSRNSAFYILYSSHSIEQSYLCLGGEGVYCPLKSLEACEGEAHHGVGLCVFLPQLPPPLKELLQNTPHRISSHKCSVEGARKQAHVLGQTPLVSESPGNSTPHNSP